MYAFSPGENFASAAPAFMRPSRPTSCKQVMPSMPTQLPDTQSVAKLGQSALVMHDRHACCAMVSPIVPATCDSSCEMTKSLMKLMLAMVHKKSEPDSFRLRSP